MLTGQNAVCSGTINTKTLTVTGLDLNNLPTGYTITLGSRTIRTTPEYLIDTITPDGSNGGTITLLADLLATHTSTPFILWTSESHVSPAVLTANSLNRVLSQFNELLGYGSGFTANDSRAIFNKKQPGARADISFQSLGITYSRLRLALDGGVQKTLFEVSADGTTFTPILTATPSGAVTLNAFPTVTGKSLWTSDNTLFVMGNSGYQKLPNGIMIQWGQYRAGAQDPSITFPVSFVAAPYALMAMIDGVPAANVTYVVTSGNRSASSFTAYQRFQTGSTTGAAPYNFDYLAIGNWL